MDTKLTLKLDKGVIEKAKSYAAEKQVSLSKLIENYLNAVTTNADNRVSEPISPYVKSISSGKSVSSDIDYKDIYTDYISEKHK